MKTRPKNQSTGEMVLVHVGRTEDGVPSSGTHVLKPGEEVEIEYNVGDMLRVNGEGLTGQLTLASEHERRNVEID